MIRTVSEKIVNILMIEAGKKSNKEIYVYGLECFISELIGNLLLFVVALCSGKIIEIAVFTITFLAIRTQLGGYHCTSHFRCLIFSTILGIISLVLNYYWINSPNIALILTGICFPFIAKYAPITHKNHPLSAQQKRNSKKWVLIFYCVFFIIAFLLTQCNLYIYAPICSGVIIATLLGYIQLIIHQPAHI